MHWPGLFFIAWGLYALITSVSHPRGYRANYRSHWIVAIAGPVGARIFFCVLGVGLLIFGSLVLFGVITPAESEAS